MIPKIIYICHKDINIIRPYALKWIELNPDYTLELYDDERCKEFLLSEFSQEHVDVFNFIPDGPIKADFWRICIMYKFGGVYADADIEPLVPFDKYIYENVSFVTCISKYNSHHNFNPHFIMTEPYNLILKKCIDCYLIYKNKKKYNYWSWSIIKVFNVLFKTIKDVDDNKIQMLIETNDGGGIHDFYCKYNNVRVMNCRHVNYDSNNHVYKC